MSKIVQTVSAVNRITNISKSFIYGYAKYKGLKRPYLLDTDHIEGLKEYYNSKLNNRRKKTKELTDRELKILDIVSIHFEDKKLAATELEISYRTLNSHLANIRVKMGIGSTRECIRIAKKLKLI